MHIRRDRYIGIAPLQDGLANACVVTADRRAAARPGRRCWSRRVRTDPLLADRFAGARRVTRPQCLGPLAVESSACGVPGLLLAGDAAGFIDPMTGDGLRFALARRRARSGRDAARARAWRRRCAPPAGGGAPARVRPQVAVQPHAALAGRFAAGGACRGDRRAVGAAVAASHHPLRRRPARRLMLPVALLAVGVRADAAGSAARRTTRSGAACGRRDRTAGRRLRGDAGCLPARVPAADWRGLAARQRRSATRRRRRGRSSRSPRRSSTGRLPASGHAGPSGSWCRRPRRAS